MSFIPQPQEIYKHFKGNLYQVLTVAEHTETGEQLVVYQALGGGKTYARPLEMFVSKVDREKYPEVAQEYRFARQNFPGEEAASGDERSLTAEQEEAAQVQENTSEESFSEETPALDPLVLEFLDADTYGERLNILASLRHRITDDMITTMAIACDVAVPEGDIDDRYISLRSCLLTLEKYECVRLR